MQRPRKRRARRGFTLIEMIAALSLTVGVVIGARLLLDQLEDSYARVVDESQVAARDANGERLLRRLLRDAEPTVDTTQRFVGTPHTAHFISWCDVAAGWRERCAVAVRLEQQGDLAFFVAVLSSGDSLMVRRWQGVAELRYFTATGSDTTWVPRWGTSITLPGALGVLIGGDTVVYPVGLAHE